MGEEFKKMRNELGLTQRQVSEETGWSVYTVRRMEMDDLPEDGIACRVLLWWMSMTYASTKEIPLL